MDVLADIDFPDIRCKCLIQSAHDGTMIIIPREGGYMFRLYVELTKLEVGERASGRNIGIDEIVDKVRRIFIRIASSRRKSPGGRYMKSANA